jgi:hypothetical protein
MIKRQQVDRVSGKFRRVAVLVSALLLWIAGSHGALADAYYVGTHLAGVDARQVQQVSEPQSVRLVVKFWKGEEEHLDVEQMLRKHVAEVTNATRLFLVVDDPENRDGATITISLQNLSQNAVNTAKSVVNGVSFGLIGSTYVNRYACTAEYKLDSNANSIVSSAEHVIFITRGLAKPPADSERLPNFPAAFARMSREVVTQALRNLAADPSFSQTLE